MNISVNPFVVIKKHQGEYFLILDDNVYHLQGIAVEIWKYIQDGVSQEDLINILANEYNANENKIKKDTEKLLRNFKKNGIID